VDGSPLKLVTNFTPNWNATDLMKIWQLPALAPGKHTIKLEV